MRTKGQEPACQSIGRQAAEGRMYKVKQPAGDTEAIGKGGWRRWCAEGGQRFLGSSQLTLCRGPAVAEFNTGLLDLSRSSVDLGLQQRATVLAATSLGALVDRGLVGGSFRSERRLEPR